MKKIYKTIVAVLGAIILLLALNFSLFAGLQVSTTLGNIGLILTGVLALVYVFLLMKL